MSSQICLLCSMAREGRYLYCSSHRWYVYRKRQRAKKQLQTAIEYVQGRRKPGPGATGQQKAAYKRWLLYYRHLFARLGVPFPLTDPRTRRITRWAD